MEPDLAAHRRPRADALAIAAVIVKFAIGYVDFATQGFYSDDFVFLRYARDFRWSWFFDNALHFLANEDWPYWRPGLHLVFRALYAAFGLAPAWFMAFGITLHLVMVLAVYAAARWAGAGAAGAALGACFLIVAPGVQETVSWTCSAIGVLPSTLLACAAGASYFAWLERRSRRWFVGAIALTAASLTFREMAYHVPLLVAGAHLAFHRSVAWPALRGAFRDALPFGLLMVPHFVWLNRIDVEHGQGGATLARVLSIEADYLRGALGLPFGDAVTLVVAVVAFVAAMCVANRRVRLLAVWVAVATFPYVAKIHADRHAYLLHATLGAALPAVLASLSGGRRALRIASLALLGLAVAQGAARLPDARLRQREAGRLCADVLAWCEEVDIARFDHLCPDFVPPALENGWASMLDLHLGVRPGVLGSNTFPWPPFQILLLGDLPPDTERAAFLRFDHQTQRYAIVPREAVLEGRVPVPLVGLAHEYEVVDAATAYARAVDGSVDLRRRVLLHRPPAGGFRPEPGGRARILRYGGWPELTIEVEIGAPCFLTLFVPAPIVPAGLAVTVDGEAVDAIGADGIFWAVPLRRGDRVVRVHIPG